MRELRQNARLSRPELERRKDVKFRRLLRHVSEHSPYYQRLFRERRIDIATCTPEDFPVLTKAMAMEHFDDIVTDRRITKQGLVEFLRRHERETERLYLDDFKVIHSSGTAGGQSYAVYSRDDWKKGMARGALNTFDIWREHTWRKASFIGKLRPRRYKIAFYGAVDGHYAGVTMMNASRHGFERLFADTRLFEVAAPLSRTVEGLNAYGPDYLVGYTTALRSLAAAARRGELHVSLDGVVASGEVLAGEDKADLEATFGCEVRNLYACSEQLGMGLSIHGSSALRLYDDDLIFEFREDYFCVTNLFNFTQPLIRYRVDDVLSQPSLSPATPYLEVAAVLGRTERSVTFTNEDGVPEDLNGMSLPVFFQSRVMRCQMQRTGDTSFRYLVWPHPDLPLEQRGPTLADVISALHRLLERKRLQNVTFEAVFTEELVLDPVTRKFPLIVDAASPPTWSGSPAPA